MINVQIFSVHKDYENYLQSKLGSTYKLVNSNNISIEEKRGVDINLIIFSVRNGFLEHSKGIIAALLEPQKSIIYMKTLEGDTRMKVQDFRGYIDIIDKVTKLGGIAILNDVNVLIEDIKKMKIRREFLVDDYIRRDNIFKFEKYLQDNFEEFYIEGKCLLSQSINIITRLNDRGKS